MQSPDSVERLGWAVPPTAGSGRGDHLAHQLSGHPQRKSAAITPPPGAKDPPPTRGAIVKRITEIGSKAYKHEAGYHRRSLAETAMYRVIALLSPTLKSRTLPNQKTETRRHRELPQPFHRTWYTARLGTR